MTDLLDVDLDHLWRYGAAQTDTGWQMVRALISEVRRRRASEEDAVGYVPSPAETLGEAIRVAYRKRPEEDPAPAPSTETGAATVGEKWSAVTWHGGAAPAPEERCAAGHLYTDHPIVPVGMFWVHAVGQCVAKWHPRAPEET